MNLRREYELNTGYSIDYELQGVGNLRYVQWLEKELLASRDSKSAVPSEEEIEIEGHRATGGCSIKDRAINNQLFFCRGARWMRDVLIKRGIAR